MARYSRARHWMATLLAGMSCTLVWAGELQAKAADVHAWHWQRTITPASPAVDQCVVLDGDLYARSAPGLRDVRLLQDGREIAYALEESFDERTLSERAADRSQYTTVLYLPLHALHPESPSPGAGYVPVYGGEGVLPSHVPVERIRLVPAPGQGIGNPVELYLRATPFVQGAELQVRPILNESIHDTVPADFPVEQTAIGANLQRDATVAVSVLSGGFTGVLLQMRQRSLCFQPLSPAPLLLLFGNGAARPVRYDYARHYTPVATPLLATLGPIQPNIAYTPPAPSRGPDVVGKRTRITLMAVAAAALLLTLAPLVRR